MAQKQISLSVSSWADRCRNKPHKTCSESWSKFHLPLPHICSLQLMFLPYSRFATHSSYYLFVLWCIGASIIAIHFSLELLTRTTPNFSVPRIDCPVLWQSHRVIACCIIAFPSLAASKIHCGLWNLFANLQHTSCKRTCSFADYARYTSASTRSFRSCAPSLWNNFPLSVRSPPSSATLRRKCLKTHLSDLTFLP